MYNLKIDELLIKRLAIKAARLLSTEMLFVWDLDLEDLEDQDLRQMVIYKDQDQIVPISTYAYKHSLYRCSY